ncbi:MAG: hypothetical protein O3C47_08255 [Bacteroidetes bacterium]|nr:hypothetical protein [Bacteroidota bacterium]
MIEVLTIGFIPVDCKSQEISCGDFQSSGTTERSYRIGMGSITGIDSDVRIAFAAEHVVPNSPVLMLLSDHLRQFSLNLTANALYNALTMLRSGKERFSSKFRIVESEGGTFSNERYIFNGHYYIRRYEEYSDSSIVNELICVKVL